MQGKRATELSIVARHNKDWSAAMPPLKPGGKRGGKGKRVIWRSISGCNNRLVRKCGQSGHTPTFNKFSLSQQMSVRYLNCHAALKNQCKQAEGVTAALTCKSRASWRGQRQDALLQLAEKSYSYDFWTRLFPGIEGLINSAFLTMWERELLEVFLMQ